ncbi:MULTISPECIES: sugar ABC transporter substrate-binding protein [Paenibacillus]|uniref:sugar ABC transporter substrate-binding protein n=1 Tax=Paenibacillus TaxID=44249 RepID=UPI0003655901|nr:MULTISPECIES: sugar-binding protein [Paenibacillus]
MRKNFKGMALLLVIMMVTVLVSACSGGANGTGGSGSSSAVSVGIVLPTKDEPRWVQDEQRFKDALSGTNYSTEILFSQGSSAKEKENVETLISKGIKVLIICPQDGAAAAAAVESAKKEGITVISYDRLITDTDAVDYYVTFDSLAVGAAQGQYLVDHAKGSGVPLYLYAGASSDNNAFLFFQGAWEVLQPKIADGTFKIANSSEAVALKDTKELSRDQLGAIIGQVTTNWDPNEAKNKAQTHLTAVSDDMKGDIAILAPNDGTARSIADVFSADSTVKSYVITGQDAEQASIQYIINKKQSMTVFKDVRTLVKDAMGMAVEVLEGKKPETTGSYNNGTVDVKAKQTDVIVVDKDNVQKELIDSGYYKAEDFTGL